MKQAVLLAIVLVCLTGAIFLPAPVHAGAVWRVEVAEIAPADPAQATGFLSSLRLWLRSKSSVKRYPVGTTFTVSSSAYASSPYQTDSTPCVTAAGTRVRPGVVASNFLPMGTILAINGREYMVEDRMNPRYNGRFVDIWFPSTSEALQFGRQKLQATIVEYGTVGQELNITKAKEEPNPIKPSVIKRASLRFISLTRLIARAIPANVNRYDVNCFEEKK